MKIRTGFVSNSSSSSFVVLKIGLSPVQIDLLKNIKDERFLEDPWIITEDEFMIEGYTSMDNFDMYSYMKKIEINVEKFVRFF